MSTVDIHLRCPKCHATKRVPNASLLVERGAGPSVRVLPECESDSDKHDGKAPRMAVVATSLNRERA